MNKSDEGDIRTDKASYNALREEMKKELQLEVAGLVQQEIKEVKEIVDKNKKSIHLQEKHNQMIVKTLAQQDLDNDQFTGGDMAALERGP